MSSYPRPSIWQKFKYYFNYLIGRDCSAKGFLNWYVRSRKVENIRRLMNGVTPIDFRKMQKSYDNLIERLTPKLAKYFSKSDLDTLSYIICLAQNSDELIKVLEELKTGFNQIGTTEWRIKFYKAIVLCSQVDQEIELFILKEFLYKSIKFFNMGLTNEESQIICKYITELASFYKEFSIKRVDKRDYGSNGIEYT